MDKSYDVPNIGDKNKKKRTGEKKARTKKSGKEVVVELQPQSEPDVVCHDDDTIPSDLSRFSCSSIQLSVSVSKRKRNKTCISYF